MQYVLKCKQKDFAPLKEKERDNEAETENTQSYGQADSRYRWRQVYAP
jgi:hypothetical protein